MRETPQKKEEKKTFFTDIDLGIVRRARSIRKRRSAGASGRKEAGQTQAERAGRHQPNERRQQLRRRLH